jgi:hypothetical protein
MDLCGYLPNSIWKYDLTATIKNSHVRLTILNKGQLSTWGGGETEEGREGVLCADFPEFQPSGLYYEL